MTIDRRAFLASAGGSLAAAWLATDVARLLAAGEHAAAAGRQNPPPPFEYFKTLDAADVEAATSQIIPSGDDGPGAREARVVYFIDRGLATWQQDQRGAFRKGIAELRKRARAHGAKTFAALSDAQQQSVIAAMDKENHEFFFTLRGATIVGMFSNPEYGGNFGKSGWKLIGFVDQFSWAPPFGWYDANAR